MLTNAAVKAARPRAAAFKLYDERGLFLFVAPTGLRSFRWRYRHDGKEKLLSLGRFPDIDLAEARNRADQARAVHALGRDPAADGSASAELLEHVAREWHADRRARWSDVHAGDVMTSLENDIFPALGNKPIGAVDAMAVLQAIRAIEARGAYETARRIRQRLDAIFAYAMVRGLCSSNPAAMIAAELAAAPIGAQKQVALLELERLQELRAAVDQLDGSAIAKFASMFLALTAVRMSTLRKATWEEIEDLDGAAPLWRVPPAHLKLTKARKADPANALLVPLSPQAVLVLRAMRALGHSTGVIFPIGAGAIGELYKRAGYGGRHVPHGWRASFSTILNGLAPGDKDVIDQALGHVPSNKVEAAYNRAEHLERRREIYCRWAQLLLS